VNGPLPQASGLPDGTRWEGFVLLDRIYDGRQDGVQSGLLAIEIRNGTVARVLSVSADETLPGPALDLRGLLLMPPLVEPHGHLYLSPWPLDPRKRPEPGSKGPEEELAGALRRAEAAFRAGIGLFRDLGDPAGYNLAVRRAAEDPARPLPRIQAAGSAIHIAGRYGRFIGEGVSSPAEIPAAVGRRIAQDRVDIVKLVPTGIINFEKGRVTAPPQLSEAEIAEAVRAARQGGRRTSAHASGAEGIRSAVAAGVDFIEHGYFIEEETLLRMAERGAVWTPTLAPVHVQWAQAAECGWSAEVAAGLRRILDRHGEEILFARRIGVPLLAGSDAGAVGVEQGRGLLLELELLEALGIPAAELISMATRRAAHLLGEEGLGRIAPGLPASFVAVQGRPEEAIGQLREVVYSVRDGRFFQGACHGEAARKAG
jgi:imidazolonepropionase-like amidohydrolase